ncbi:MAG TPA: hypothetical protein VGC54_13695 [Planctomycetota bacterium]
MNAAGRRLLIPALATLAAGLLLGWVAGRRSVAPLEPGLDPELAAWHAAAVDEFGLVDDQAADLRILLRYYDRERRRLELARLRVLEPELAELDARFELLIWNRILRGKQRTHAARLVASPYAPAAALPASAPDR